MPLSLLLQISRRADLGLLRRPARPCRSFRLDAILAETPPKLLSEFGFFDDLQAQQPAAGVVPFRLDTPLFSDGAEKFRFVYLPDGQAGEIRRDRGLRLPGRHAR